jgi:hypothetical protein
MNGGFQSEQSRQRNYKMADIDPELAEQIEINRKWNSSFHSDSKEIKNFYDNRAQVYDKVQPVLGIILLLVVAICK